MSKDNDFYKYKGSSFDICDEYELTSDNRINIFTKKSDSKAHNLHKDRELKLNPLPETKPHGTDIDVI
jgi:hypothetical protein